MRVSVHNIYSETRRCLTTSQAAQIPPLTEGDRFRFAAKVERRGQDDCWLWTASAIPNGHGQMTLGARPHNRPYYAHRIAWTLANGDIPAGMFVLHTCDVPRCVNPRHLFLGDQNVNMKDAARKGRLSIEQKRNRGKKDATIARYLAGGITMEQLARECDVCKLTVQRWVRGATGGADQRARGGNHKRTGRAA